MSTDLMSTAQVRRGYCAECDFIGPELPGLVRDARELHRAVHPIADTIGCVVDRAVAGLSQFIASLHHAPDEED